MQFIRKNVVPIAIFFAAFTLRIAYIQIPINTDEVLWLRRGAEFINRLMEGDFNGTYLKHHPGVTNMWMVGTGWAINDTLRYLLANFGLGNVVCNDANCLVSAWSTVRTLQAFITSVCTVGIYSLSKRLFNKPVAIVATSLLVLEPFYLAYQRFITTDAFQANFSFLAILSFLLYLKNAEKRCWMVVSGIFMGLAIASKIPAVFITFSIPLWIVAIETRLWSKEFVKRGWLRQGFDLLLWGGIVGLTFVLIWPALWTNPLDTLNTLREGLIYESNRGNLFFLGKLTDSPGISFYPFVLALRLSPILQIGIIALGIQLLFRPRLVSEKVLALGIIPIITLLILSISSSKIDRYIMAIVPELVIISTAGWFFVSDKLIDSIKSRLRETLGSVHFLIDNRSIPLSLLLLFQVLQLVVYTPYFIAYYNPLFGGIKFAEKILMIGQGEGLEQAAYHLNEDSKNSKLSVCTWYSLVFEQYFQGPISGMYLNKDELRLNLLKANRIVLYVNQLQRQLPSREFLSYFTRQTPLEVVNIQGLNYARIYKGLLPLEEDIGDIQVRLNRILSPQLTLLGYNIEPNLDEQNTSLNVHLFWKVLGNMDERKTINVKVVDRDRNIIATENQAGFADGFVPFSYVEAGTEIDDFHHFQVSNTSFDREYCIEVELNSPNDATL